MDTTTPRRIVRVEATFSGKNRKKRGSGLRLRPGWVLTSQHVLEHREGNTVERAEKVNVMLAKPAGGKTVPVPAEVAWRGEEDLDPKDLRALDAALLREDGLPEEVEDEWRFVPTHLPTGECETAGWIRSSPLTDEFVTPDEFSGRFYAIDEAATLLPLRIEGLEPRMIDTDPFSPYGGVSGAPVFVSSGRYQGCLYGVVRKGPTKQPDRLYAVSTPALLRNDEFRQLLGISDPSPPNEKLILRTRQLLSEGSDLAELLAKADPRWHAAWMAPGRDGGVDGLLAELCERGDLRKLLEVLDSMAKAVAQGRHPVESIQQWASHLTGLLAHQFVAREGRKITRRGIGVGVPLHSPTYAEAALSSVRGEAPRYERRDGTQRAVLEVPISQIEAGINADRRLGDQVDSLARRLLTEDLATPRYLSKNDLEIIEGEEDQERFATRLEAVRLALDEFRIRNKTDRYPYVLVTPKLRMLDKTTTLNGTLQAFLDYLAEILPELEQVELSGSGREGVQLENQLKPLWRILGIEEDQKGNE